MPAVGCSFSDASKRRKRGGRPGRLFRCTVCLVVVETMELTTIQNVYEGCFEQLMNNKTLCCASAASQYCNKFDLEKFGERFVLFCNVKRG